MRNGAFDEAVEPDRLGVDLGLQPIFVGAAAVAEHLSWENAGEAPNGIQFFFASQQVRLKPKSVSMHPVIGIDACDQISLAMCCAPDQAFDDSFMGLDEDAKT